MSRLTQEAARDVSEWPVVSQESRGLDVKEWKVYPGGELIEGQAHWWLFKPVKTRSYRRFDDHSEVVASRLATMIDLPSAEVRLARDGFDDGVISRNVTPNGWRYESGDTVLSDVDGYISCAGDNRPKNRVGHSLSNIASVLEGAAGSPFGSCSAWRGMEVFAGFLIFDAWIANTDRHAINWGVLVDRTARTRALAPSFDHGSGLASGSPDHILAKTDVRAYAKRGTAGRFEDGHRTRLTELAGEAVRLSGGRATVWLDRVADLRRSDWADVLYSVAGMTGARRSFLTELLAENQRRLTT